jgi:hypothetical protein
VTQLLHLRRMVRSRLGVPPTDQMFTDDQLDDHINLAVETVDAEQRWPWHEHVQEIQVDEMSPDIPLGPDWRATRGVFISDGNTELQVVSSSDVLSWPVGTTSANGRPAVWAPVGDRILIRPLASGPTVLTHYYYTQPTWLRADSDEPAIPDQFIGSVVAKAAELLSTREDDRAAAGAHNVEYNEWIGRMRRDVRRSTSPIRVRVRAGSWLE